MKFLESKKNMSKKNWPSNIFDSLNDLSRVEKRILELAKALYTVGLTKSGDELFYIQEKLQTIWGDLRTNISNHCAYDLKNAQQNSVNVLNAVLAGKQLNSTNHDS
jgi:hypothetical protein